MEAALTIVGLLLGLCGEFGLLPGILLAFLATVLAARGSPSKDILDGLSLGLWLLLSLLAGYAVRALRRTASRTRPPTA